MLRTDDNMAQHLHINPASGVLSSGEGAKAGHTEIQSPRLVGDSRGQLEHGRDKQVWQWQGYDARQSCRMSFHIVNGRSIAMIVTMMNLLQEPTMMEKPSEKQNCSLTFTFLHHPPILIHRSCPLSLFASASPGGVVTCLPLLRGQRRCHCQPQGEMKVPPSLAPVAKECADIWPRIASNAGTVV